MKKYFFLFACLYIQTFVMGQKASIANAEKDFSNNNLEEARNQAELVLEAEIATVKAKNEKLKQKGKTSKIKPEVGSGKTYALLGRIYASIALSDDPAHAKLSNNPVQDAMNNFNKVKELEKENSFIYLDTFGPSITGKAPYVDDLYSKVVNKGVDAYNKDDMQGALKSFENGMIMRPLDTNLYLNALSAAGQLDDKEKLRKYTKKLIELGKKEEKFYNYLVSDAMRSENYDEAAKIIKEAKEYLPEKTDLIAQEVKLYILTGKADEAIKSLEKVLVKEPNNETFTFNLAILYDESGNSDKAIAYYNKTIELNKNHEGAHYNLSALYYNAAVKIANELNKLSIDIRTGEFKDQKTAKELKNKIEEKYKKALPGFEKTVMINDKRQEAWQALAAIYSKLGMDDKREKAKKKLQELE